MPLPPGLVTCRVCGGVRERACTAEQVVWKEKAKILNSTSAHTQAAAVGVRTGWRGPLTPLRTHLHVHTFLLPTHHHRHDPQRAAFTLPCHPTPTRTFSPIRAAQTPPPATPHTVPAALREPGTPRGNTGGRRWKETRVVLPRATGCALEAGVGGGVAWKVGVAMMVAAKLVGGVDLVL